MARVALVVVFLLAPAAWACPTCTCGNPALLAVGADQPFDGRLRLGTSFRAWQQQEAGGVLVRELRLDLLGSWSPTRRWTFVANLPLQVRERTEASLARERGFGSGELDLSARFVILGAQFHPKHLLSAIVSARLPTAPTLRDGARGEPLALDAQLGPGAFVPATGLTWSSFLTDQLSTFVSLIGEVPLEGRYGLRPGPAVQLVASGQYQPWRWLGVRLGVDSRYDAPGALGGVEVREHAGLLLQALADVVVSPTSVVLLIAGARVPFADLREARPAQSPILQLSVVVDL